MSSSTMRPAPHKRDWSSYRGELRGSEGHNPARLRFEFIMKEMKTWFRARAVDPSNPKKKGVSRKVLADEEFFAWDRPFFHNASEDADLKRIFRPYGEADERANAVAELDGWFQYVKANPKTYPSLASLPRLTDPRAFPVIAAALASIGIEHHEPVMLTEEDRYLQQHSLAASHRRLSHRQQAIYGISQRTFFGRGGF